MFLGRTDKPWDSAIMGQGVIIRGKLKEHYSRNISVKSDEKNGLVVSENIFF